MYCLGDLPSNRGKYAAKDGIDGVITERIEYRGDIWTELLHGQWAFRFTTAADPTNGDSLSKSGNLTSLNDDDACGAGLALGLANSSYLFCSSR